MVAGSVTTKRLREERGQGLVEYALILALVSLAAILALGFLSGKINDLFSKSGNSLNTVNVAGGGGTEPVPEPAPAPAAITTPPTVTQRDHRRQRRRRARRGRRASRAVLGGHSICRRCAAAAAGLAARSRALPTSSRTTPRPVHGCNGRRLGQQQLHRQRLQLRDSRCSGPTTSRTVRGRTRTRRSRGTAGTNTLTITLDGVQRRQQREQHQRLGDGVHAQRCAALRTSPGNPISGGFTTANVEWF